MRGTTPPLSELMMTAAMRLGTFGVPVTEPPFPDGPPMIACARNGANRCSAHREGPVPSLSGPAPKMPRRRMYYQLIFTIGLMRSRGFSSMTRKASSILSNPSKA